MTCLFINYVTYFQHAFNVIFSLNSSVRIWFSCRVLKLLPSFLYQNSFRLVILIINILILTFNVLSHEFKLFPPSCRIIFSITDSNSNVLILKLSQNLLCPIPHSFHLCPASSYICSVYWGYIVIVVKQIFQGHKLICLFNVWSQIY